MSGALRLNVSEISAYAGLPNQTADCEGAGVVKEVSMGSSAKFIESCKVLMGELNVSNI